MMTTETTRRRFQRWTAISVAILQFHINESLSFTAHPRLRIPGYSSPPSELFLPQLNEAPSGENCGNSDDPFDYNAESVPPATLRMDDGGSDLTDRFKYKVRRILLIQLTGLRFIRSVFGC